MIRFKDSVVLEKVEDECIMVDLNTARYLRLNQTAFMMSVALKDSQDGKAALELSLIHI